MSEKQFKVGDKVRMVRTVCFDFQTYLKGSIGEITEVRPHFARVKLTNAETGAYGYPLMCIENIELMQHNGL